MPVNAVGQPHAAQAETTHNQGASQKAQSGGSKANTAPAAGGTAQNQAAEQTKAAAAAQNNAGREQGNAQKTGGVTTGKNVNVFA
jgi:hypothetical protein